MSSPTPPIAMSTPKPAPTSVSTRFSTSSSRRSRADAGAERGAHHQLVLPAHAAHQRQVGDVGGRDDQDERRGAHEQPERQPGPLAQHFLEGDDRDAIVGAGIVRVLVNSLCMRA